MKTLLYATAKALLLPGTLLLGATAVLVISDALSLPVVLVDAHSGKCAGVRAPEPGYSCERLPQRYHREYIAPLPGREPYQEPPVADLRSEVAHR